MLQFGGNLVALGVIAAVEALGAKTSLGGSNNNNRNKRDKPYPLYICIYVCIYM
jgi:hypothetical protein